MSETINPSIDNEILNKDSVREIGKLESFLGPENYRIVVGLLKTPASIAGFILIIFFIIVAAAAPILRYQPGGNPS